MYIISFYMKKILLPLLLAGFFMFGGTFDIVPNPSQLAFAQGSETYSDFEGIIPSETGPNVSEETKDLSERIKRGDVHLVDIFIILVKMIDLVTKLAGTIAVLFLIYGGYQYMLGGLTDDKEGAKKTIQYAITGLIVTFMAYVIVNLVTVQFLGK